MRQDSPFRTGETSRLEIEPCPLVSFQGTPDGACPTAWILILYGSTAFTASPFLRLKRSINRICTPLQLSGPLDQRGPDSTMDGTGVFPFPSFRLPIIEEGKEKEEKSNFNRNKRKDASEPTRRKKQRSCSLGRARNSHLSTERRIDPRDDSQPRSRFSFPLSFLFFSQFVCPVPRP